MVAKDGRVATPINAGLRPPPPAAYGVDSACHPAADCHQEVDGKVRPIRLQMSCRKISLRHLCADPDRRSQIDLRGNIPSFIHVSDGKMHEVNVLDLMTPEPGSFSIMDRGFLDFARLYRLTQAGAFFVIRPKSNTAFQRVYSRSVDKTTGLRCDQTVRLIGVTSANDHPQYLRYVVFYDEENDKRLGFFTNNFELPALTIAQLYKCRWQVELFFKWIKQHLRIKAFFGTNENAVKTQSGSPSVCTCSLPSSKNVSASQRHSTQSYRFSASRFSRKHRWINCLTMPLYKI